MPKAEATDVAPQWSAQDPGAGRGFAFEGSLWWADRSGGFGAV